MILSHIKITDLIILARLMCGIWADADTDIIIIGHYAHTLRKDPSHMVFKHIWQIYSTEAGCFTVDQCPLLFKMTLVKRNLLN